MKNLQGQLLISSSRLFDPNFRHTVILVGQHTTDGALGVVLNRPLDASVAQAVPALIDLVPEGEALFEGGPVQPSSPILVADMSHPALADIPVFDRIGFLTGEIRDDQKRGIVRARVFAGYSGWDAGQLEAEMAQDSWVLDPAQIEDVFTEDPDGLWQTVLKRMGPDFQMMSRVPFDPRMN